MPELRIASGYDPLPRQVVFHTSPAKIRGYGGAMAGGKTRALCEDVFQELLDNPGISLPIFRLKHVSLAETTKRCMVTDVIPPELLRYCDRKQSGGEDYVRLPNGSTVHFAGLDDPIRWFSSELGGLAFDEAHEIPEDSVLKLMTRLRQRGMPGRIRLCFNPENPGHWLHKWFISGAEETETGWRKAETFPAESSRSIGASEFVFAKATDNPYVSQEYIDQNLAGLSEPLRRRYLEGEWLFVSGLSFFDGDALTKYDKKTPPPLRRYDFVSIPGGQQAKYKEHRDGAVRVYAEPVEGHSYAIGADAASGSGRDSSAAYVVDLGSMEFVAEFHGKLDEDLFGEQLHFLGRRYNTALVAVEHQGGMGNATLIALKDGKSGRPKYPNIYRHKLDLQVDIPTTKRLGFPMTQQTRPHVLNELASAIREESLPFLTTRLLNECTTFVNHDSGTSPRAQEGCHDDCVMAAAVTLEMYRQRGRHPDREARIAARRAPRREKKPAFPWLAR